LQGQASPRALSRAVALGAGDQLSAQVGGVYPALEFQAFVGSVIHVFVQDGFAKFDAPLRVEQHDISIRADFQAALAWVQAKDLSRGDAAHGDPLLRGQPACADAEGVEQGQP